MKSTDSGGNAATETEAVVYLFNTMEVLKMLEESGVPRAQAEAHVKATHAALSGAVATKADLKLLEVKMEAGFKAQDSKMDAGFKALDSKMEAGFKALDSKMEAGFKAQDSKMDAGFKAMRETMAAKADLSEMKTDMMKWFFRTLIAMSAVNVAAVGILIAVLA